jgi:predicted MFS family arabinose efflux permease
VAVFSRGLGVDLALVYAALTARSAAGALGPFLASVADSRGRKTGMLFGVGLFSVGLLAAAIWPSYTTFLVMLVLTILGVFVFNPSMQAYLGDRVPYRRRGLALALTELGWSFAFIAGVPLVGLLLDRGGWQAPFPVLAGLGLAAFAVLAWLLPSDRGTREGHPGAWMNLKSVFTTWPAVAGLLMGMAISAANESVNAVFGVWMEASFGLKIAGLGATAVLIGVSELGAEGLSAGLVDRLGKPRAVTFGLALNSLAALALPLLGQSLTGAVAGLVFFYITFEFTIVCTIPLMTEVLPPSRATLMAAYVGSLSLGRALADLLATRLVGMGILSSGIAAVIFNILALLALQQLRIAEDRKDLHR